MTDRHPQAADDPPATRSRFLTFLRRGSRPRPTQPESAAAPASSSDERYHSLARRAAVTRAWQDDDDALGPDPLPAPAPAPARRRTGFFSRLFSRGRRPPQPAAAAAAAAAAAPTAADMERRSQDAIVPGNVDDFDDEDYDEDDESLEQLATARQSVGANDEIDLAVFFAPMLAGRPDADRAQRFSGGSVGTGAGAFSLGFLGGALPAQVSFEQLRTEVLDGVASLILNAQEMQLAEMELTLLERLRDVEELEAGVVHFETAYDAALRAPTPTPTPGDESDLHQLQLALVLARLMASTARKGYQLAVARHTSRQSSRGSAAPPGLLQMELSLAADLQILGEMASVGEQCLHLPYFMAVEEELASARQQQRADQPSLRALPVAPSIFHDVNFKIKCQQFRVKMLRLREAGKQEVVVSRENLVAESTAHLINTPTRILRRRLMIRYAAEEGKDMGGLARDWISKLGAEIFSVGGGCFELSGLDNASLQVVPNLAPSEAMLKQFDVAGRLVGLALFHGHLLDAFFIGPFFKMMRGDTIGLDDLAAVDPDYHRNLLHVLSHPGAENLGLYFAVDTEAATGDIVTTPLVPGGELVPVTDANKAAFVAAVLDWRFCRGVARQMERFMRGLTLLVPFEALLPFAANELELLVCGLSDIDIADWQRNAVYENGYTATSQMVAWFWQAVAAFDVALRAKLLQFVTGTSRLPGAGFKDLHGATGLCPFTLYRVDAPGRLPVAHTCINRLDLPETRTYLELTQKLTVAISETAGFGLV